MRPQCSFHGVFHLPHVSVTPTQAAVGGVTGHRGQRGRSRMWSLCLGGAWAQV